MGSNPQVAFVIGGPGSGKGQQTNLAVLGFFFLGGGGGGSQILRKIVCQIFSDYILFINKMHLALQLLAVLSSVLQGHVA